MWKECDVFRILPSLFCHDSRVLGSWQRVHSVAAPNAINNSRDNRRLAHTLMRRGEMWYLGGAAGGKTTIRAVVGCRVLFVGARATSG